MVLKNLNSAVLVELTIQQKMGYLADTGALVIRTGKFTGRSPKDRYIVKDQITKDKVDWGNFNIAFDSQKFDILFHDILAYKEKLTNVYETEVYACAHHTYKKSVRFYTEFPWQSLFIKNMFINPNEQELNAFSAAWVVYCFPNFEANPMKHGTRQENFAIINIEKKTIIIGGTAYTGEMKKGVFSTLNFLLPTEKNVLPMHCSANVGHDGDTALFFGLSGTGKTTLSTSPDRFLIGDDEHGWSEDAIFNFEGGCYAKIFNLAQDKEPDIFNAIKFGSLVENINFLDHTRTINYNDKSITENSRVSYPINYIEKIQKGSTGSIPKNIFFLSCDAFGVLPPIAQLSHEQIAYQFISGYTAKLAGTEQGVVEPVVTFSPCFGAPFMLLSPLKYAQLLQDKIKSAPHPIHVWLINTGWSGGPFGVGRRIQLSYTRAMIEFAMEGKFDHITFEKFGHFNLMIPQSCEQVPSAILNPKNTWANTDDYDKASQKLADLFEDNYKKFK
ncbi:MAG: phosphoenolpyruvate carboxykinase (ATP) [Phycisphaerales bacterium]|nr:phosphoenolpyruvate carboxykinase (ATP) [Phycisphaerales bacterium]